MIFDKSNLSSYAIYLGGSAAATAVKGSVKVPSLEKTSSIAEKTIKEAPWLFEAFPEMVLSGALAVNDGQIYLYGLSVLFISSILAITVTLGVTVTKFIMDVIIFRRSSKEKE